MNLSAPASAPEQDDAQRERIELSVFIPLHNEQDNVSVLMERLYAVLDTHYAARPHAFEVIVVNDGSTDSSLERLRQELPRRRNLSIVDFRRNFGQTAAMMAGIEAARGDVLISLDADLQNFPEDIPALLTKLHEGYDVVSGWRRDRKDAKVRRNFLSSVANGGEGRGAEGDDRNLDVISMERVVDRRSQRRHANGQQRGDLAPAGSGNARRGDGQRGGPREFFQHVGEQSGERRMQRRTQQTPARARRSRWRQIPRVGAGRPI